MQEQKRGALRLNPMQRALLASLLPFRSAPSPRSGLPASSGRRLPPGMQYRHHVGAAQQARVLRQSYRRCLKFRDDASRAALRAIHDLAAGEAVPDRETAAHHLAHVALQKAEETGVEWAWAVAQLLEQLEESAAPGPVAEAAT